ncbi:MAG TPA: peptide deformylase [Smithellaceae bacterium]|nr:peptide deformylase [Smithellaceae bacterium]
MYFLSKLCPVIASGNSSRLSWPIGRSILRTKKGIMLEIVNERCYVLHNELNGGILIMSQKKVLTLWSETGINEGEVAVLRKKSKELPVPLDKEALLAVEALKDSFLARDDASGLAAPQIGINKRIIAFRTRGFGEKEKIKNTDDYEILINPRITQARGEKIAMAEGCLSCPDIQVEVSRFPEIKIRALNSKGEKISKRYLDYVARVIQHEIDHLDGKLIVDYEGNIYYPKNKELFFSKIFQD